MFAKKNPKHADLFINIWETRYHCGKEFADSVCGKHKCLGAAAAARLQTTEGGGNVAKLHKNQSRLLLMLMSLPYLSVGSFMVWVFVTPRLHESLQSHHLWAALLRWGPAPPVERRNTFLHRSQTRDSMFDSYLPGCSVPTRKFGWRWVTVLGHIHQHGSLYSFTLCPPLLTSNRLQRATTDGGQQEGAGINQRRQQTSQGFGRTVFCNLQAGSICMQQPGVSEGGERWAAAVTWPPGATPAAPSGGRSRSDGAKSWEEFHWGCFYGIWKINLVFVRLNEMQSDEKM